MERVETSPECPTHGTPEAQEAAIDEKRVMAAPYPDRETAAHMLAEEIAGHRKRLPKHLESTARLARVFGLIDGLHRAALILNIEDLVDGHLLKHGFERTDR